MRETSAFVLFVFFVVPKPAIVRETNDRTRSGKMF